MRPTNAELIAEVLGALDCPTFPVRRAAKVALSELEKRLPK